MSIRPTLLHAGQCAICRYSKTITSARGSQFVLCQLANSDKQFVKYPRLPVIKCPGFVPLKQPEKASDKTKT